MDKELETKFLNMGLTDRCIYEAKQSKKVKYILCKKVNHEMF